MAEQKHSLKHCICKEAPHGTALFHNCTHDQLCDDDRNGPQSFTLRKMQMVDLCSVCLKAPSCHVIWSHDVNKELTGVAHGVLEGLATGGEFGRDRGELSAGRSSGRGSTAP